MGAIAEMFCIVTIQKSDDATSSDIEKPVMADPKKFCDEAVALDAAMDSFGARATRQRGGATSAARMAITGTSLYTRSRQAFALPPRRSQRYAERYYARAHRAAEIDTAPKQANPRLSSAKIVEALARAIAHRRGCLLVNSRWKSRRTTRRSRRGRGHVWAKFEVFFRRA